ncbi:hypothetical protein WN55_02421 [Dufourea novaeangliae]|uniref:Uncharacterized protein n=1 Tax=Dufourea novaeangliae TaxID=178035 RepID=A0A154PGQ8_DUFNO|nr:hypothetical protein WN55_02421 [Dufourea novaeangliae]
MCSYVLLLTENLVDDSMRREFIANNALQFLIQGFVLEKNVFEDWVGMRVFEYCYEYCCRTVG